MIKVIKAQSHQSSLYLSRSKQDHICSEVVIIYFIVLCSNIYRIYISRMNDFLICSKYLVPISYRMLKYTFVGNIKFESFLDSI